MSEIKMKNLYFKLLISGNEDDNFLNWICNKFRTETEIEGTVKL